MSQLMNESIARLFVEQPRLHWLCYFFFSKFTLTLWNAFYFIFFLSWQNMISDKGGTGGRPISDFGLHGGGADIKSEGMLDPWYIDTTTFQYHNVLHIHQPLHYTNKCPTCCSCLSSSAPPAQLSVQLPAPPLLLYWSPAPPCSSSGPLLPPAPLPIPCSPLLLYRSPAPPVLPAVTLRK